ncbi:hypothetical protein pdam_00011178 [Pocillopora damicornis]|uniref:Uncharacterized protein n=1 Tax=Pocillopora damicornis TaxID=46731 RepID=A0A3M6TSU6_POCDA|nr:hypothetical protein pdam_00011178 [Pocillopora damicornis]
MSKEKTSLIRGIKHCPSYLRRHQKRRMMHFPLVLLVCVSSAFKLTCEATDAENSALGRVIDLRKVNLLADFQEEENRIFEELPPKCLVKKTLKSSSSHFEYYANTKEFYKSLATQSSLSASLQSAYSLGVTVSVATKSKSSQQSEIQKSCVRLWNAFFASSLNISRMIADT